MPSITLKDIPRALHRELKARAKAHHRSLNKEVIATLTAAASAAGTGDNTAQENSVARSRSLFARPVTLRQISVWKRAGRL